MHDLIPLDTIPPGALVPHEDLETAHTFAEHEKAAAASRRAYNSDWAIFTAWCVHSDLQPLPASPQAVAAFIAAEAQAGRKASTITRRLAAIHYAHRLAGHEPPTNAEAVKATMRGIRRTIGTAAGQEGAGHPRPDRRHAGDLPRRSPRRARLGAHCIRLCLRHAPL